MRLELPNTARLSASIRLDFPVPSRPVIMSQCVSFQLEIALTILRKFEIRSVAESLTKCLRLIRFQLFS
jgi:hypothetical protein